MKSMGPPGDETSLRYYGWRVVGASTIGMIMSPGPLINGSAGLFAGAYEREFGWSRGDIMLSLTMFNIAALLAAPVVGYLIDRFGARTVLIVSVILFGFSVAMPSFGVSSLYHLYGIFLVIGFCSMGAQSVSYAKLITTWFDEKRGLAIGIATSGFGIGYAVVPIIVERILQHGTWQTGYLALSGLVFLLPLTAAIFYGHAKKATVETGSGAPTSLTEIGLSAPAAVRTGTFWILIFIVAVFSCILTGIVPHMIPISTGKGLDTAAAATVAAMFGVSAFLARPLVGYLIDRFFAPYVAMAFFSLAVLGLVLFMLGNGMVAFLIAAALVGIGFGTEGDLIAYFVSRYFGLRAFGQIYGYNLSAFIIGAAGGPIILGYAYDAFGGYTESLIGFVGAGIIAILMLSRLGPYPRFVDTAQDSVETDSSEAAGLAARADS